MNKEEKNQMQTAIKIVNQATNAYEISLRLSPQF